MSTALMEWNILLTEDWNQVPGITMTYKNDFETTSFHLAPYLNKKRVIKIPDLYQLIYYNMNMFMLNTN